MQAADECTDNIQIYPTLGDIIRINIDNNNLKQGKLTRMKSRTRARESILKELYAEARWNTGQKREQERDSCDSRHLRVIGGRGEQVLNTCVTSNFDEFHEFAMLVIFKPRFDHWLFRRTAD